MFIDTNAYKYLFFNGFGRQKCREMCDIGKNYKTLLKKLLKIIAPSP